MSYDQNTHKTPLKLEPLQHFQEWSFNDYVFSGCGHGFSKILKFWPLIQTCPWLMVYWKEVMQFISWTSSVREEFWLSIALPSTTYGKKKKIKEGEKKMMTDGLLGRRCHKQERLLWRESRSVGYSQCFWETSSRLKLLWDKKQVRRQDHQGFVLVDFINPGTAIPQCRVNYNSPPPCEQVGRHTS